MRHRDHHFARFNPIRITETEPFDFGRSAISGEDRKLSVLVVDDEELVADSLVEILNMFGYSAFSLCSGAAAITRATEKPLMCSLLML